MQDKAVDIFGAEVVERTGKRLGDLGGQAGVRVVWQPVILAAMVCELRLQKKLRAGYDSRPIQGFERLAYASFQVMPPLVGCVDSPEAAADRKLGEGRGTFFFPCGAVEEWRDQVLPQSQFIVVKAVSVPQSTQILPRFPFLERIRARTHEIVFGNRVRHPLQVQIRPALRFLYRPE
jgi:hypothetical protein